MADGRRQPRQYPISAMFICVVWLTSKVFEVIERDQLLSIRIERQC